MGSVNSIEYALRRLKKWIRPQRRATSIWFLPGSGKVVFRPLGVVGVMSPWNYPVHLTMAPLAAALAAGNRVMIKMSEVTPTVTGLTKRLLSETFAPDHVAVIDGDAEVGKAFAALAFDHLLFTGSSAVGRQVLKAASENLTPVTLELSGKSPAIIVAGYPLRRAARRIVWGKLFNAGQTCVAPDYALVPRGQARTFQNAAIAAARTLYPSIANNQDYTSIASDTHYQRLRMLVEDARAKGADIAEAWPALEAAGNRKFPFTTVLNPSPEMTLLREEIFGPVLPILEYDSLPDAMAYVADRPSPLAMYVFSHRSAWTRRLLAEMAAGGVTVNDTLLHYLQDDLPFGGVGVSGMGRYHGREGFETFSQRKAVFAQRGVAGFTGTRLLYPPYGLVTDIMLRIMGR